MASDGQIVFEVTADGKHAIADIRDITRAIQQEAGKWDRAAEQSTGAIGDSFSGMLKKIAAGFSAAKIGKLLLDIGKDAVQAASDLQEVQNVVDTTFGEGAKAIEAWAKTAGTQFGLTEVQAKRFASTLGAMMKSSGLAGDQIVEMSTDLAGLAADMASFYNLDFDTAFQKIRSGISGETEPLKQLGINMSVANLNAFALQQGLSKTYEEMTQGEQVMLRYQYIMAQTSDAQGDFAKTSDSYANAVRTLETNLQTLSTNLGTVLLEVITPLINGINELFPKEKTDRYSLLDDLAQIKLDKEEKIREITEIKAIADELIVTLETLAKDTTGATVISSFATGVNELKSDAVGNWEVLLKSLTGIDGLDNLFADGSNAVNTVEELAAALAGESVTTSKAQAWDIFLSALADNAEAMSKLTGKSVEETRKWIEGMAQAAHTLDPNDAEAWQTLMNSFTSGIDFSTPEGSAFREAMTQNFLAMGSESEVAKNGLLALGYSTEEIEKRQASWLRVCRELVRTIPGLSDIIDINTGEVKGGIPAIKEYADEWERTAKYQAEIEAIRRSQKLYSEANDPYMLAGDATTKRGVARAKVQLYTDYSVDEISSNLDRIPDLIAKAIEAGIPWENIKKMIAPKGTFGVDLGSIKGSKGLEMMALGAGIDPNELKWFNALSGEAEQAVLDYAEAVYTLMLAEKELPIVEADIAEQEEKVAEAYGMTAEEIDAEAKAAEEAYQNMSLLERAALGDADAMSQLEAAVNEANDALKSMADYAESVHESVLSSINSVANSLDKVDYMAYGKKIERISELTAKQAQYKVGSDEWKALQNEIDKVNGTLVTTDTIMSNLESQATFLDEYLKNLRLAREMGLSPELLAELSDGSVESAEYLAAIVNGDYETAMEIDAKYREIQDKKAALAEELTSQQLTVDETYQAMVDRAKEAIAALDMEEEAAENSGKTVQGIAEGIAEKIPEVADAVDGIISELERLNGYGIDIDLGGFGNITFTTSTGKTEGSSRMGLDFVPHDDYIARLHEGERVLTAQENQIWNALRNGGVSGFDLETLGGVMRDNVKAGGNVYLDGRVVGSVISDQQGKSYRQLQRSGWQG